MANMIISTYMSVLPRNTMLFCAIVLCIGFFGIFIPYQERKKKNQQTRKHVSKPPEKPAPGSMDKKQLDQLETLRKAGILSEEEYRQKKRGMR